MPMCRAWVKTGKKPMAKTPAKELKHCKVNATHMHDGRWYCKRHNKPKYWVLV